MSTFLITGGSGFIGSHIAEELSNKGHLVKILDNSSTSKKDNLGKIKAEIIKGDIRDLSLVKKSMRDVDCVFHEAALASVTKSIEDPILTNEVNVNGTLNVLAAARDSGCKKVVFASSSSVYGDAAKLPIKENSPLKPASPYAVTKLVGEQYCRVFYENYGLESVCLRYFNVYGPRQDTNSEYAAVIPKFISSVKNNRPPTIFGDGRQTRDFVFVKDVVQANMLSINFRGFGIFNVCSGKAVSINEIAEKIIKSSARSLKPAYSEPRKGDIMHSLGDSSNAKEMLKFESKKPLEDGLKETLKWFGL